MIIKSSQRAGHQELAKHLMKQRDIDGTPQVVTVSGSRDLITGDDVYEALDDMAIMAQASDRCQKDLYHVSMSPAAPMDEEAWAVAWDAYEQEFGLQDQPFIEVTHAKGDNRPPHKHRCYSRVDIQTGRAVAISHNYVRNELVSRLIEYNFGHDLVIGKFNRSVMKRLRQEGENEIVAWMEAGHAHSCERPAAKQNHQDVQQEKRTRVPTDQVVQDLTECFERTDNGRSFEVALAEKGYVLARGDRRDFVVIDWQGAVHSPRRRIKGVKAKALREKWNDLDPQHLPTVAEVVATIEEMKATRALAIKDTEEEDSAEETTSSASDAAGGGFVVGDYRNTDTKLESLFQEAIMTQELIAALEQEIEAERLQEEVNYWQRQAEAELERTRPRQETAQPSKNAVRAHRGGKSETPPSKRPGRQLLRQPLIKLQGSDAIAERQRRLLVLANPIQSLEGSDSKGLEAYHQAWQKRFGKEGSQRGVPVIRQTRQHYRLADRWIIQRLAKKGYSRQQARRILMQASPEVMNQRPGVRLQYVRRMTEKIYGEHEKAPSTAKRLEQAKAKEPSPVLPAKQRGEVEGQGGGNMPSVASENSKASKVSQNAKGHDRKEPELGR